MKKLNDGSKTGAHKIKYPEKSAFIYTGVSTILHIIIPITNYKYVNINVSLCQKMNPNLYFEEWREEKVEISQYLLLKIISR